jgi:DNA damage-binding protein 1
MCVVHLHNFVPFKKLLIEFLRLKIFFAQNGVILAVQVFEISAVRGDGTSSVCVCAINLLCFQTQDKHPRSITMAHTYVVSSQKSTAVHHAVTCNFISPEEINLIVVKNNKIEVFSLLSESLNLKIKTSLYGKITSLHAYRPRSSKTDVLFVLTERKFFCVLGYDPVQEVLITLAKGNVKDRVGHDIESGQRALLDPTRRMIGMLLYDGFLKVLPLGPNGNFQEAFNVPLEEPRLIDIAFLYQHSKPTFCLLYEDNKMGRHLKTYSIDTREKICTEGSWQQSHVEFSARMLIPVNDSAGGVLVVGQSTITYFSEKSNPFSIGMDHKFVTSYCPMDAQGGRYLLGDKRGVLSVLILLRDAGGGGGEVTGLVLEDLGETSISERICCLEEGLVFVGSCFGDSQLVRLLPSGSASTEEKAAEATESSSSSSSSSSQQVEVLETHENIGPILDMCVVPSERPGQSQVVTCSGAYKDGSLRVIKSGIGIREQVGGWWVWHGLSLSLSLSLSLCLSLWVWEGGREGRLSACM